MCFAVPIKVIQVADGKALLEDGRLVILGPDIIVNAGEYVRTVGDIIVDTMSAEDGNRIRQTLEELSTYE